MELPPGESDSSPTPSSYWPAEDVGYNIRLELAISEKIVAALRHNREEMMSEEEAFDAAFHLTDWLGLLHKLHTLYEKEIWDPAYVQDLLIQFLIEVPAHLAAAHRLVLGHPVTDVFKIGAVEGTGEPIDELDDAADSD